MLKLRILQEFFQGFVKVQRAHNSPYTRHWIKRPNFDIIFLRIYKSSPVRRTQHFSNELFHECRMEVYGWPYFYNPLKTCHLRLVAFSLKKYNVILDFLITVICQSNPQNPMTHLCNAIVTSYGFLWSSISAYLFLLFALFPSI